MEPLDLHYVTMTNYDEGFRGVRVVRQAQPDQHPREVVSAEGRRSSAWQKRRSILTSRSSSAEEGSAF